jgi:hypothetical protein
MRHDRNDVRAVIEYLSSLWGLASGLSLLFPLSNALLQAVPNTVFIEVQPKTALTPALLTTFATIMSLFSILLVISTRREIAKSKSFGMALNRMRVFAVIAFGFAIFVLLLYTATADTYRRSYERISDSLKNQGEMIGFFGYPLIFASFTTAFTLLGLREYLLEQWEAGNQPEQKGPVL